MRRQRAPVPSPGALAHLGRFFHARSLTRLSGRIPSFAEMTNTSAELYRNIDVVRDIKFSCPTNYFDKTEKPFV